MKILQLVTAIWLTTIYSLTQAAVYQTTEAFLNDVFKDEVPKPKVVWLTGDIRQQASQILSHPPVMLRTRYWQHQQRSIWILEEIGKEKPITTGIVVYQNKIEKVRVLAFRESRGWEVRRQAFTRQFKQAGLTKDNELNKSIDGITGATLSVRALKRLARLALYLDSQVRKQADEKK